MNPLVKKIKNYAEKTIGILLLANAAYLGGLWVSSVWGPITAPRIHTASQLESVVNNESARLDLQEVSIEVHLYDEPFFHGSAEKIGDNSYRINLHGLGRNISTLRHELYHIADGHCDGTLPDDNLSSFKKSMEYLFGDEHSLDDKLSRLKTGMEYLYVDEPQAIIYETTGIQL